MTYCNSVALCYKDLNKYVGLLQQMLQNIKDCIFLAALQKGAGVYEELEANPHYAS